MTGKPTPRWTVSNPDGENNPVSKQEQTWQWQWRNRLFRSEHLSSPLGLSRNQAREMYDPVVRKYPFSITPYYWSLANIADPLDPIRLQCLPDIYEISDNTEEEDPLGENKCMPVPGLIHRYHDRCLIVTTHRCAVYCRHCNRKRLWQMSNGKEGKVYFQRMIHYIREKPQIREVILSGGDPLMVNLDLLNWLLDTLRSVRHVEVLRVGSRIPVVMPMRIDQSLCDILKRHRPLWLNTQFNHPREITRQSADACSRLIESGIPVSNQSVLLRGVNDNEATMKELLYGLQKISVRPYYLFQCDPVAGTRHFHVPIAQGIHLIDDLRQTISGLCLPQYVIDMPGRQAKVPLGTLYNKAWDSHCIPNGSGIKSKYSFTLKKESRHVHCQ